MGEKSYLFDYRGFWLGALIATIGFNVSLTASLLNLYRFNHSAKPILAMMLIEALVPILGIKFLSDLFLKWQPQRLFSLAAVLGMVGPLIQSINIDDLVLQYAGITFCSAANAIQRPLMMQMASFIARSESCRLRINKLVAAIGYLGVLLGYLGSGLLLTYSSYEACFFVNAAAYLMFFGLIQFTSLPVHKVQQIENEFSFRFHHLGALIRKNTGLLTIYVMAFALWFTGGSINALEIPFAKKEMSATDGMVSMLFFATASGSILYSSMNWRLPSFFKSLPLLTGIAGLLVALYVLLAKFEYSLPILLCFGFLTAIHGVQSMTQLQNLTEGEDLSNATIALNTLNQTVGLIAAGLGVLGATMIAEKHVCLGFALATCAIAALYYFIKVKRVNL